MDILPIPVAHLDDVWPHVWPHLSRGIEVSGRSREQLAADILADKARVWMATSDRGRRVVHAAWLTEIANHDGKRVLMVFGMGGRDPELWTQAAADRICAHAKEEGCDGARFAGRKGWMRLLGKCRQVGTLHGEPLFERDMQ